MNNLKTILSIVPGRHRLGYSVFYQKKLVFYGVTSLSAFKAKAEICKAFERFLMRIVSRFQIDKIAIRKLAGAQEASTLLSDISEHLRSFCKKRKIKVICYDGDFINRHFCKSDERPTNDKTAIFLATKYPELKRYHKLKKEWQQRHYAYVFKAIALGLVCLAELERKKSKEY
jgi:hypothetical protein